MALHFKITDKDRKGTSWRWRPWQEKRIAQVLKQEVFIVLENSNNTKNSSKRTMHCTSMTGHSIHFQKAGLNCKWPVETLDYQTRLPNLTEVRQTQMWWLRYSSVVCWNNVWFAEAILRGLKSVQCYSRNKSSSIWCILLLRSSPHYVLVLQILARGPE